MNLQRGAAGAVFLFGLTACCVLVLVPFSIKAIAGYDEHGPLPGRVSEECPNPLGTALHSDRVLARECHDPASHRLYLGLGVGAVGLLASVLLLRRSGLHSGELLERLGARALAFAATAVALITAVAFFVVMQVQDLPPREVCAGVGLLGRDASPTAQAALDAFLQDNGGDPADWNAKGNVAHGGEFRFVGSGSTSLDRIGVEEVSPGVFRVTGGCA